MEFNKAEASVVEKSLNESSSKDHKVTELSELQLSLVGGGIGSVIFG